VPAWIVWLDDQRQSDRDRLGPKAANLATLSRRGFLVPPAFCITAEAYHDFVASVPSVASAIAAATALTDPNDLAALREASETILAAVRRAPLSEALMEQIGLAYADARLGSAPATVAVRSSATAEDLPGLSFAGQYETFLNVQGLGPLTNHVRDCWTSLWSPRAVQYRLRWGVPHGSLGMAVICQRMVPPAHAGVLFTADPIASDRAVFVVNIHPGLGEAVVGGSVTATQVRLRRDDGSVLAGDGHLGPPVSRAQLVELVSAGRAVERVFAGVPQDIEWAYTGDGRLHLLQARPITTLGRLFVEPDSSLHWNRKVLGEWMEEPLSPMFGTLLVSRLVSSADRLFRSQLGTALKRPVTKEFHGYLYLRADVDWQASLGAPLKLLGALAGLDVRWRRQILPLYRCRMAKLRHENPEAMDDADVLALLEEAATSVADFAGWVLVSAIPCLFSETLFALLTRRLEPEGGQLGYTGYLTGVASQTVGSATALANIAQAIREDEALRQLVLTADNDALPQALTATPGGNKILSRLHAYLEQFGHQSLRLDLVHPTFAECPAPLWAALRLQVTREAADSARPLVRRATRVSASLLPLAHFRKFSPTRVAWRAALRLAQRYLAIRDDRPFYLQLGWPVLRRALIEFGRRFATRAWLAEAHDIFYVEYPELLAAARDGTVLWTPAVIEHRKSERAARQRLNPPDRINPGGFTRWLDRLWRTPAAVDGDVLHGFAGSPGRRRGIARVVTTESDYASLKELGSILVTRATTPAWTPLFALVSGVVTEVGSPLSHAAIVAREYGIPCVIAVPEATRRIRDGQEITVDGDAGCVILHNPCREVLADD